MKTGYSIRTWKKRIFCPEQQLLDATESYYREITDFYFKILKEREHLWNKGILDMQGEVERLTVAGRDGRVPQCPLPYEKIPVYFRRSAMNKAAAALKSVLAMNKEEEKIAFPESIQASVTFFKGMYRNLTDSEIELKLWNGKKWVWIPCTLSGRDFPKDGILLSPSLYKDEKRYMLHIPVKQENSDARNAKERMAAGSNICSVRFTNTDVFAVCCALDKDGKQLSAYSCRGGDSYRHHCRQLMKKVEKSAVYTQKDNSSQPNKKYFMHLKHLSEHYAHQVSREIVDFCKENQAGAIVLPVYNEDYSKMVMYKTGNFTPLHLSNKIREFLSYKAWAEGILILEVKVDTSGNYCSLCGAPVKKKGKMFYCENGHEGNRFLNDARQLGVKCQESFRKNAERGMK